MDIQPSDARLGFFDVGHEPIDRQHDQFCALMQALAQTEDFDFGPRLLDIHTHLLRHCADEERWMCETAFPAFAAHKQEHEALLEVVSEVRRRCDAGDVEIVSNFAAALPEWFGAHANTMDAALAFHLKRASPLKDDAVEAEALA